MQNDFYEREVYLPSDIVKILGISKGSCYDFLNKVYKENGPFRVIKINSSIRVPKEAFDAWLKATS